MSSGGEVFVSSTPFAKFIAVIDSYGQAVALRSETKGRESLVGDIWLGKVARPVPGHEAVFVSLGDTITGMLNGRFEPGTIMVVQIVRDSFGSKAPLLTNLPVYSGKYLLYCPEGKIDRVSRKIKNTLFREKLKKLLNKLNRPKGAFIARRFCDNSEIEILEEEARWLVKCAQNVDSEIQNSSKLRLLYSAGGLVGSVCNQFALEGKYIWFDDQHEYNKSKANDLIYCPSIMKSLRLSSDEDLFERYDLHNQWQTTLGSDVLLPSGGKLTIEETAACVTIDVDSGTKKRSNSQQIACYEAIAVCGNEIIRRNLAGLIAIDLPLVFGKKETDELIRLMQSALDKDQVSSDVLGLSHGGVLEVTRQRIGPSLLQALTEQNSQYPWFTRRWRPEITAHRAICKARREINSGSSAITICANQCVLDLFSDYNSIAHWLRASFYIQEDNKMSDDDFEVHSR
tara:strand:+ start:116 stop:1483 length:1368 start_codon:yes stop_codon:yes gene_type:complete